MRSVPCSVFKTMLFLTILFFIGAVSGTNSENVTNVTHVGNVGEVEKVSNLGIVAIIENVTRPEMSKMVWLKALLDHHDWDDLVNKHDGSIATQCAADLRTYLTALHQGKLWASKMYDASGQYSSQMLFGNEYWLGSKNACKDLQLKKYYKDTPPYPTVFYVIKVNVTIGSSENFLQNRLLLVGECLPRSCNKASIDRLLKSAASVATRKATAAGVDASFISLYVREVPGTYNIFHDFKMHIMLGVIFIIGLLMLAASFYEACLERQRKMQSRSKDLELASNNNNKSVESDGSTHAQLDGKQEDNKEDDLRRDKQGIWAELLLSFSVLSNGRAILSTTKPSDGSLTCLHGMRFLSVGWVIMVHTYLTVFHVADNKTMRVVTERNFMYQSVGNASYCVDTFFFISGLLVTVLFLRAEDKKKTKRAENLKHESKPDLNKNINGYTNPALNVSIVTQNGFISEEFTEKPKSKFYTAAELARLIKKFLLFVSYRFIRLTPAYAFVIGLNELALRFTHNNTVFEPAIFDQLTCAVYWWRNLLYINNFFPMSRMCMVWSWYMANDTQFYVVGILLLLISKKHLKFSFAALGVIMVSSWATSMYISVSYLYKAKISEPFEMFDALYDKPWSRIGPYLVGMLVGYYLHRTKCQVRIPYWLVVAGWPASVAIVTALIFGMVDGYFEVWPTAFYVSVGHTAWGAAMAWITIACCCGYGGLINSFLSYSGLLPLSRLTYCAYLVHPTIMMYTSFLMDGPMHLQNSMVLTVYAGYAVFSFLASFAISLAFEAPAVRLLKIINGRGYRRTKRKESK